MWPIARPLVGALLVALGVIIALSAALRPWSSGVLTVPLIEAVGIIAGWGGYLFCGWLVAVGIALLLRSAQAEWRVPTRQVVGAAMASLAVLTALHLALGESGEARAVAREGGGLLGMALAVVLVRGLGEAVTVLLLALALAVGLALLFALTPARLALGGSTLAIATWRGVQWLARQRRRPEATVAVPVEETAAPATQPQPRGLLGGVRRPRPAALPAPAPAVEAPATPRAVPGSVWKLPPITVFDAAVRAEGSPIDTQQRVKIIEETLASFNVQARVVEINQGPSVTQFGLEPAPGVPVNRILARANDIALRLGAAPIRMEAPVPGKQVVGIEVPNTAISVVKLREVLESAEFERSKARLRVPLGRDVAGRTLVGDLTRMPHLLIAGATGSGKSVCVNVIVASLLYQATPDELQFLMVDPKMVELVPFNGVPHLRMPVVTDMDKVVGALKWTVQEMERRLVLMRDKGVKDITGYNRAVLDGSARPLPYLVVIIDELADLMMTAPDEVERHLCRLAQLARATGIHLVVATQRPSVNVVTGLIKANFPTRIAFAVTSQTDSRVILDGSGAEKLLGRGDMLYAPTDATKPFRLQGAYVSEKEVAALVEFWKAQGAPRYSEEEVRLMEQLAAPKEDDDADEYFERACEVASQYQRISVSLLQRRLGIGYPRAARLLDLLEERGIVAPSEDGRSKVVVAKDGGAE